MEARQSQRIAVAIIEHEDCFVIGPRPAGVPLSGFWEFPGGKIADGESAADAAIRECLEETGLRVEVVGELLTVVHDYAHGRLALQFIRCRPREARHPRPPFRWVRRHALAEYRFPEANRQIIERLVDESGGR
jgi:mutator protein MutT